MRQKLLKTVLNADMLRNIKTVKHKRDQSFLMGGFYAWIFKYLKSF